MGVNSRVKSARPKGVLTLARESHVLRARVALQASVDLQEIARSLDVPKVSVVAPQVVNQTPVKEWIVVRGASVAMASASSHAQR